MQHRKLIQIMPLLFDQKRPCNLGCIISTQSKGIGDSMWPQIQAAFSNPAIFVIMFRFIFLTPGSVLNWFETQRRKKTSSTLWRGIINILSVLGKRKLSHYFSSQQWKLLMDLILMIHNRFTQRQLLCSSS